ncbi:MAG TPA: RES family NAD+ phosphorylase [Edaphocola sp.]|nr:RES family NAD+ phosphorylase [Edaphocola sp.]
MEVFRISKCAFSRDLSGTGARIYGGRWNSKGLPVLYTAGSRALALLETLVHVPQKNLPKDLCLTAIQLPGSLSVHTIRPIDLPKNWRTVAIQSALQEIGNKWLKNATSAMLCVPSVILPEENNYLINPLHPEAEKIKITSSNPFIFDDRLLR